MNNLETLDGNRIWCFFIDVMNHLQVLNLSLQKKNKIVSDLAQTIFSFLNKIKFSRET